MKVKICGLRRPEDISYINDAKPDYAGFILSPGFRRSVAPERAAELIGFLGKEITPVGVFVDEDLGHVLRLLDDMPLSVIQLHGRENRDYARKLADRAAVIKVFRPDDYDPGFPADHHMIDPGKGDGRAPRWDTVPKVKGDWFLAGGINESNISDAAALGPYCLDISSGVESDGVKDRDKILRIVERIRML